MVQGDRVGDLADGPQSVRVLRCQRPASGPFRRSAGRRRDLQRSDDRRPTPKPPWAAPADRVGRQLVRGGGDVVDAAATARPGGVRRDAAGAHQRVAVERLVKDGRATLGAARPSLGSLLTDGHQPHPGSLSSRPGEPVRRSSCERCRPRWHAPVEAKALADADADSPSANWASRRARRGMAASGRSVLSARPCRAQEMKPSRRGDEPPDPASGTVVRGEQQGDGRLPRRSRLSKFHARQVTASRSRLPRSRPCRAARSRPSGMLAAQTGHRGGSKRARVGGQALLARGQMPGVTQRLFERCARMSRAGLQVRRPPPGSDGSSRTGWR